MKWNAARRPAGAVPEVRRRYRRRPTAHDPPTSGIIVERGAHITSDQFKGGCRWTVKFCDG